MNVTGNTILITGGASGIGLYATREEINQGTRRAWENFLKNNPDF